jgi:hypothetical protein
MDKHALEVAYRLTTFYVDDPSGNFGIKLDEPCPQLDALLATHAATQWAYVTAWNPRSQLLSAENNAARHEELLVQVVRLGYPVITGRGQPADADWVAEESLLILGIEENAAVLLGARFGQHAIVVGRAGECAELRWCESGIGTES